MPSETVSPTVTFAAPRLPADHRHRVYSAVRCPSLERSSSGASSGGACCPDSLCQSSVVSGRGVNVRAEFGMRRQLLGMTLPGWRES